MFSNVLQFSKWPKIKGQNLIIFHFTAGWQCGYFHQRSSQGSQYISRFSHTIFKLPVMISRKWNCIKMASFYCNSNFYIHGEHGSTERAIVFIKSGQVLKNQINSLFLCCLIFKSTSNSLLKHVDESTSSTFSWKIVS